MHPGLNIIGVPAKETDDDDSELEEGEINDNDPALPRTGEKRKSTTDTTLFPPEHSSHKPRTAARRQRRALKAIVLSKEKEALARERREYTESIVKKLFGVKEFYLHEVRKNKHYEAAMHALEAGRDSPLRADDPRFQALDTVWLFEPGIHAVFDLDGNDFVFACRIEPFDTMLAHRNTYVSTCLQTIMDYTTCVPDIKLNAAQNKPHGMESTALAVNRTRFGKMFGAGWHSSMEKGKTLVAYAPFKTTAAVKTYENCYEQFPAVAGLYREGLLHIFPGGADTIDDFTLENQIPSFAAMSLDGESNERPFANSLTITRNDFSNYLHVDMDEIEIAFGLWWVGKILTPDKEFCLDPEYDHKLVKGGAFLLGEYGIGVDFERARGLVQIYWRGKFDRHVTMQSTSPPDATRFGTSVQLTARGTAAVDRFWSRGAKRSTLVTPTDRINTAMASTIKRKART